MLTINTHKKFKREGKKDACRIVFAMIDRKWKWDIDNLFNCLRGIFVFFGPSCRAISSIRKKVVELLVW